MTDWTEPDHADEEWVQPWELPSGMGWDGWPVECAGPEYWMAVYASYEAQQIPPFGSWIDDDFYAERPRWVSDRD